MSHIIYYILYMNLDWFCHTSMIKELDEKEMNPFGFSPVRILFVAKSGSGKSFVNRYI